MKYFTILMLYFLLSNCSSYKDQQTAQGNYEVAIHNTIIDFTSTRLFQKGKVFKLDHKSLDDDFYNIMIIEGFENKYLYSESKRPEENRLPSRYLELNGRLFIWWDDNYPVTEETFNMLKKHGMLKDDEGGWIKYWDGIRDEKKKAAEYFICKNNLKIYKRVIDNVISIQPKLDCR